MTFKLFKIFLSNIFTFSDFLEGFKKGPKGILKNIFIIFCFLYLIVVSTVFYIMFTMGVYSNLEYMGQIQLFPGVSLLMALLIILNFGLISAGASYYAGNGEDQFFSMPITPKEFFGAKFGVSFVTESLIGIFLFVISSGYYGYKQGLLSNPLFYIGTLVTVFTASLIVIAFIYLLLIAVLYFIPSFRKKSILNGISSFFIIVFAMVVGFSSGFASSTGSLEVISSPLSTGPVAAMINASRKVKVLAFLGNALNGNILTILVLIAIAAFIIFVVIPLLSKPYIKTFEGYSELKQKKISKEKLEKVVKTETKRNSIFKAMFIRDLKGIFREPTFFANGPLMVFLFPVIIAVAFFMPFIVNGESIAEMTQSIQMMFLEMPLEQFEHVKYYVCFGLIAFALFVGNMSSIPATSFSREGKGFYTLKAMPIKSEIIIKVKFFHSFMYILISYLIVALLFITAVLVLGIPFSLADIITILIVTLFVLSTISILLIIIDMLFDTMNPKLNWENPAAALKQNMNSLFAMLVAFGTIGIFVALSVCGGMFFKPDLLILVFIGALFGIIAAPVGSAYFKYAEKRIPLM